MWKLHTEPLLCGIIARAILDTRSVSVSPFGMTRLVWITPIL